MTLEVPTLRVEMRFKNARLYNAIREASVPTSHERRCQILQESGPIYGFCKLNGLPYQLVSQLLNLKVGPYRVDAMGRPKLRPVCARLASVLERDLEWLFPLDLYEGHPWPRVLVIEGSHLALSLRSAPREALLLPPSQDDDVAQRELREALDGVLQDLRPKERCVIVSRFGLDGSGSKTLEEVGQRFGVTRESINKIEHKALSKLRHPSRARRLKGFLENR